jgi:hypothetical protein
MQLYFLIKRVIHSFYKGKDSRWLENRRICSFMRDQLRLVTKVCVLLAVFYEIALALECKQRNN